MSVLLSQPVLMASRTYGRGCRLGLRQVETNDDLVKLLAELEQAVASSKAVAEKEDGSRAKEKEEQVHGRAATVAWRREFAIRLRQRLHV